MRGWLRLVAGLASIGLAAAASSHAAVVKVLDPDGHPVPNSAVSCPDGTVVGAGEDGVAHLPDHCRRVHCEHGDFAPVDAVVKNREAVCRFPLSVRVEVVLPPGCDGESHCSVWLTEPRRFRSVATASTLWGFPDETRSAPRVRFPSVPLATYDLHLRGPSGWTCTSTVALDSPGSLTIQATWHEPVSVRGTVSDAAGRLREGIPVRAVGNRTLGWHCHPELRQEEAATDAQGRFQLDVDPAADSSVEAGDPDDILGMARASLPGGVGASLELKLSGAPSPR